MGGYDKVVQIHVVADVETMKSLWVHEYSCLVSPLINPKANFVTDRMSSGFEVLDATIIFSLRYATMG